jgi:hypothetical protein
VLHGMVEQRRLPDAGLAEDRNDHSAARSRRVESSFDLLAFTVTPQHVG